MFSKKTNFPHRPRILISHYLNARHFFTISSGSPNRQNLWEGVDLLKKIIFLSIFERFWFHIRSFLRTHFFEYKFFLARDYFTSFHLRCFTSPARFKKTAQFFFFYKHFSRVKISSQRNQLNRWTFKRFEKKKKPKFFKFIKVILLFLKFILTLHFFNIFELIRFNC